MPKPTLYWILLVLAVLEVINIPAYFLARWHELTSKRRDSTSPPANPNP